MVGAVVVAVLEVVVIAAQRHAHQIVAENALKIGLREQALGRSPRKKVARTSKLGRSPTKKLQE